MKHHPSCDCYDPADPATASDQCCGYHDGFDDGAASRQAEVDELNAKLNMSVARNRGYDQRNEANVRDIRSLRDERDNWKTRADEAERKLAIAVEALNTIWIDCELGVVEQTAYDALLQLEDKT